MGIFILWVLMLSAIFMAVVSFVLYLKGVEETKKSSADASKNAELAKKCMDAYTKIKNAPQVELQRAKLKADEIVKEANRKAEEIAGTSMDVLRNTKKYEQIVVAMRNRIKGYGDEYLIPLPDLIDELAFEFEHTNPGQRLKAARDLAKKMIKNGMATDTKCKDPVKAKTLSQILLDAFIGKTENILEKTKNDNFGKLKQEMIDCFTLINRDSSNIEDTRISQDFYEATLDQLKWACIVQGIRVERREEQRRIREKIREEEKALREYEKVQKEALKEEEMLQKAMALAHEKLSRASQEEKAKLEEQLKDLGDKLAIAEEKGKRAISMAQQTKSGHVYIISNIGSFGENIFKIGLTRRLEPLDRVRELGDSSVPFEFDVHALIKSEDAPALENKLHKHFVLNQVNKVNYRKEFFKVGLAKIREEIEKMGLEASWTMTASALEYRETKVIEKKIQEDPIARESWVQRQLELDPTDIQSIDYHLETSAQEE